MRASLPLVVLVLFGCSAGKESGGPTTLTSDAGSEGGLVIGDDGGGGLLTDGDVEGGVVVDPCPEELKQIYVVTDDNELYRFAPATVTFTKIGSLSCPSGGFATPFSMAVDRKGTAWVLFSDGKMYQVSTKDASCKATSFAVGQSGFTTFGMSFARDGANETLYVADYNGKGIAKIDTTSLKLSFIGSYGTTAGAGELTAKGEQLYGFFNSTGSLGTRVAMIDKTTGKLGTVNTLSGVTIGSGWAFAHWGGTFWLFHAPSSSSQVTEYDFDTKTTKTAKTGLGFVIVGAGVSTCAPTERPK